MTVADMANAAPATGVDTWLRLYSVIVTTEKYLAFVLSRLKRIRLLDCAGLIAAAVEMGTSGGLFWLAVSYTANAVALFTSFQIACRARRWDMLATFEKEKRRCSKESL